MQPHRYGPVRVRLVKPDGEEEGGALAADLGELAAVPRERQRGQRGQKGQKGREGGREGGREREKRDREPPDGPRRSDVVGRVLLWEIARCRPVVVRRAMGVCVCVCACVTQTETETEIDR